ncbi:uncharacterized protein LOC125253682 isoform X2 [Megalobrama amblycephala]|uniref:uncharacterized protein LOC125253682 isoform X2 n=1 Tax=Megalobrama amblycephala TaxID=75352 RepID=UPI0020146006|nr:uncharacterized protein LOC125253682 isoform X2 [Megalobrama amblycephala]
MGTEAIHLVQIQSDISMRNHSFLVLVLLLVVGVFGVTDVEKIKVSVMQGDSVTLLTDHTEIQTGKELQWMFPDDTIIAEIDREANTISVPGNTSFKGRLKLNETTGSLTITNIKTTDSGVYQLQFRNQSWSGNMEVFSVTVHGVFSVDGVKKMSAMKGESVILHTKMTDIPKDDVIEWTFGPQDTALAKTDTLNKIRYNNETFKDRLELNTKSGDLTVDNINTEVLGFYRVKIIKRTYTLQKIFSVTLNDSRQFPGTVLSVIFGVTSVVLACAAAVLYYKNRQLRQMYCDAVRSTDSMF